jgi:hypothetical protein
MGIAAPIYTLIMDKYVSYQTEHWEGEGIYFLLLPNQEDPIKIPFNVLITDWEGVYVWRITSLN